MGMTWLMIYYDQLVILFASLLVCYGHILLACYMSKKWLQVETILCSECFNDAKFITGHSSLDFVRMNPKKDLTDVDGDIWTDQETLLLLEAVEKFNDNWNEIAEHVITKSKAQCILHFLRLPMEADLLENIEVPQVEISPVSLEVQNGGFSCSNPSNHTETSGAYISSAVSCKIIFLDRQFFPFVSLTFFWFVFKSLIQKINFPLLARRTLSCPWWVIMLIFLILLILLSCILPKQNMLHVDDVVVIMMIIVDAWVNNRVSSATEMI